MFVGLPPAATLSAVDVHVEHQVREIHRAPTKLVEPRKKRAPDRRRGLGCASFGPFCGHLIRCPCTEFDESGAEASSCPSNCSSPEGTSDVEKRSL